MIKKLELLITGIVEFKQGNILIKDHLYNFVQTKTNTDQTNESVLDHYSDTKNESHMKSLLVNSELEDK